MCGRLTPLLNVPFEPCRLSICTWEVESWLKMKLTGKNRMQLTIPLRNSSRRKSASKIKRFEWITCERFRGRLCVWFQYHGQRLLTLDPGRSSLSVMCLDLILRNPSRECWGSRATRVCKPCSVKTNSKGRANHTENIDAAEREHDAGRNCGEDWQIWAWEWIRLSESSEHTVGLIIYQKSAFIS
jgi:hypothetical protein